MKPFNYVQTNDWYQIELLVLDSNTWNHLTGCKQITSGSFKKCYQLTIHKKSYVWTGFDIKKTKGEMPLNQIP